MRNTRSPYIIICSLVGLLGLCSTPCHAQPAAARPNIVLILADDWGYPHAGIYGYGVATPAFDSLARGGALFTRAHAVVPSCTPSRASLLAGRYAHQLGPGAHLWGHLPAHYATYPSQLQQHGYAVGHSGKGWGPGNHQAGGYSHNPAGPSFPSLSAFLESHSSQQPFCFWVGSHAPHRPYHPGRRQAAWASQAIAMPSYFPATAAVRGDVADYLQAVQTFDSLVGNTIALLKQQNLLNNTLVVVTSDHGWPFPRGKANLYDQGTRVPLLWYWPGRIAPQVHGHPASLVHVAASLLQAAGVPVPAGMQPPGFSFLWQKTVPDTSQPVFTERERHAYTRLGNASYPSRAVHHGQFLLIRNLEPQRWPAGDSVLVHSVGAYGDCDPGPTKQAVMAQPGLAQLAFGLRPQWELYDLKADPEQLDNLAGMPQHAGQQQHLQRLLLAWMQQTKDPRLDPANTELENAPYYGPKTAENKANRFPNK